MMWELVWDLIKMLLACAVGWRMGWVAGWDARDLRARALAGHGPIWNAYIAASDRAAEEENDR